MHSYVDPNRASGLCSQPWNIEETQSAREEYALPIWLAASPRMLAIYRISGIFPRREISAKMTLGRCVKFSLSPIFAISKTLNEYVDNGLFFAVYFLHF